MSKSIAKWKETFGTNPVRSMPNTEKVQKAWDSMGHAFGKIQVEKLKYQKAGMTEVVKSIDDKWKSDTKALEEKTLELMGYPRLPENIKRQLQDLARSDGLFLNTYQLQEYKKIPPPEISEAVMEAKQYFDSIEIWAIEQEEYVRPIKDPAVIGFKKIGTQYYPSMFLIATWGDDITPEDLGITVLKELEQSKDL